MAKTFLIDSDVFIDYLMGSQHAKEFLEQLPEGVFHYATITKLELLSAPVCGDPTVRSATTALLSLGKAVELEEGILNMAADLKREHGLSLQDSIIAAAAFHLKAELVTKDISAFRKIPGLLLMKPY